MRHGLLLLFLLTGLHAQTWHVVEKGETWYALARRSQCSVEALRSANPGATDLLRIGQKIRLPEASATIPTPVPAPDRVLRAEAVTPPPTSAPVTPPAVPTPTPTPPLVDPRAQRLQEWRDKLKALAMETARRDVDYGDTTRTSEGSVAWDCSDTVRYVYRRATGLELPRTASDQYVFLAEKNVLRRETQNLPSQLQPGDLLFWEHTYRPPRQPPVTHVMIYIGVDPRGRMIMFGSQTGPGLKRHNDDGGPDLFVFNPATLSGGYWNFFIHRRGRFVAYARPLDWWVKR
jgi:cell wall-associated NlpC family hydrolase